MIDTYNIEDSYNEYRKELLRNRLKTIKTINPKEEVQQIESYKRLPIKFIERLENKYGIVVEVKDPTLPVYNSIVHGYLKFLMKKVLEGNDVRLGARLGTIGVRGKKVLPKIGWDGKIKGVVPSWSKTKIKWTEDAKAMGLTFEEYLNVVPKEERQLVFCFNEHTEYIRYRIVWYKKNVIVSNKTFYRLAFNRVNRRALWNLLNSGKEYLVIE